jgi:hypothetical protein
MRLRALWIGALALGLLVSGTGCGRRLVKVRGVVTLDGKPLSGATVNFFPESGSGNPASDYTASDGSFNLTTLKPGDGVVPGFYKVVVTLPDKPVPKIEAHEGMSMAEVMGMYFKALKEMQARPAEPLPQVAKRYTNVLSTPLHQNVPTDGPVLLELTNDE